MELTNAPSRRDFLSDVSRAAVFGLSATASAALPALAPLRAFAANPRTPTPFHLEDARLECFTPYLGDRFSLRAPGGKTLLLVLTGAQKSPSRGRSPVWSSLARSPFAIEFSTSTEERIPQGTYRIEHAALGRFDLFLVPIGPPRESQRYQAVFG